MTKDMKEKWKLSDPNHILGCIEQWRNLDLRKNSDDEVDATLRSFLESLKKISLSTTEKCFHKLWRIRKLEYLIKDISECWEPPEDATKMGRCNAKGHPVLYVSEKPKTPFEELSIKPQEQVYLIKYKQKEHLTLGEIVPKARIPTDINKEPIYDENSSISYQILREFMRSEFLKPASEGTEYLYRISGSICRIWFDGNDIEGWLYPSVQSPNDLNLAIKPEVAHSKLEIEDIRIVKMVENGKIRNSRIISDDFLPFFNLTKLVMQHDFKGEIREGKIIWHPSNDLRGYF